MTPLLLIAQRYLGTSDWSSRVSGSRLFYPLVGTAWGAALPALFSVLTLLNWNFRESPLSIIPAFALLLVYTIFLPRPAKTFSLLPPVTLESAIRPLSVQLLIVMIISILVRNFHYGSLQSGFGAMLSLGLAKALSWYFINKTVCDLYKEI